MMIKRIFTLNFLDSFVAGIVTVAVPLLMLERGISLAAIGIIFALAPIAKLLVRLSSAAIADAMGERVFYSLSAAANAAQSAIYLLFQTPSGFAAGKALDGASDSFIWAVNRSSIIAAQPHRGHFVIGSMVGWRQVYFAAGCLAVALLAPIGGYFTLFALALGVSLACLAFSFGIKNAPRREKTGISDVASIVRGRTFLETAGAMALGNVFYTVILYLLIPLYLGMNGFSLLQIGLAYAGYFLIFGFALHLISHLEWGTKKAAMVGACVFAVALAGMSFAPQALSPYFFLFMAIGDANLALVWEEIIYLEAKKSERKATAIALLHAPDTVGIFALSGLAGFIVSGYGFAPIFIAGALSLAAYAAWSLRLVRVSSAKSEL